MTRSIRARPLLLLTLAGSALLFGWAGWVLPSRPGTALGLLSGLLSCCHVLTLSVALVRPERLRTAWRALSWLSLAAGALFAAAVGWSGWELSSRFGSLGRGVTVLLAAIGVLLLLATLPFAVWGLRATKRAQDAA